MKYVFTTTIREKKGRDWKKPFSQKRFSSGVLGFLIKVLALNFLLVFVKFLTKLLVSYEQAELVQELIYIFVLRDSNVN